MQIYAGGLGDLSGGPPVALHENHDWSFVGIFKGSSVRRDHSSILCMRASTGVLNRSATRLALMWRLDSLGNVCHVQKLSRGEKKNERIDMNSSA